MGQNVREPLTYSRERDGGDFRAGRDSGRRRVLDVHKAADGDAMHENSPRPSRRRGREAGLHGKGLAAFGLRPEALDGWRTIAR